MFTSIRKAWRHKGSPVSRTMSMREPRARAEDVDSDDSLPKSWAKKVRNKKRTLFVQQNESVARVCSKMYSGYGRKFYGSSDMFRNGRVRSDDLWVIFRRSSGIG